MHQWQTVYEYRHIIAVSVRSVILPVLVYHLQEVAVYVALVYQPYVLAVTIIKFQQHQFAFLYYESLFLDTQLLVCNLAQQRFPFRIAQTYLVQLFELLSQVRKQVFLLMNPVCIFIALIHKLLNEGTLQIVLTLIALRGPHTTFIACHYGTLILFRYNVKLFCHGIAYFRMSTIFLYNTHIASDAVHAPLSVLKSMPQTYQEWLRLTADGKGKGQGA